MAIPEFQKPKAAPRARPTIQKPVTSPRSRLLALEGASCWPCMTAAHTWIECQSHQDSEGICYATGKQCILAPFNYALWLIEHKDAKALERAEARAVAARQRKAEY